MNAWPKQIGEYKLNKADAQSAFYLRQIGALSFYHALDVEIRHANSNPNLTLLHVARLTATVGEYETNPISLARFSGARSTASSTRTKKPLSSEIRVEPPTQRLDQESVESYP